MPIRLVCLPAGLPACLPACLPVCLEGVLWQNAEWMWVPFGVVSGVDRGMGVLDGVVIIKGESALL